MKDWFYFTASSYEEASRQIKRMGHNSGLLQEVEAGKSYRFKPFGM